jgi:c-di-GMP-related signal transduction protein
LLIDQRHHNKIVNVAYLTASAVNPELVEKPPRLNATGAVSGVITTPDVSFIQNSLTELPSNQLVVEVRRLSTPIAELCNDNYLHEQQAIPT